MKADLLVLIITVFFIANAYQDNKYTKYLKSMKKYYNMALVGFAGLSFYLFMKKYPSHAYSGIGAARELLKTLPVDSSAGYMFDPIFNTVDINLSKQHYQQPNTVMSTVYAISPTTEKQTHTPVSTDTSTQKTTKRSVSETKKKYVASQQGWKCGHCQSQLNAWFEVDHKHSLETGGSNHVSNLVALCRECHGKKTSMERMGML